MAFVQAAAPPNLKYNKPRPTRFDNHSRHTTNQNSNNKNSNLVVDSYNGPYIAGDGNFYSINGDHHMHLTEDDTRKALQDLRDHIAPGAFHNSAERFDPPKCHPGTRNAVLKDIMGWIESVPRECPITWLHGPAGAGKSAIAQTICEKCQEKGQLAASFFFSRSTPGRDSWNHLVPTISYQLAVTFPRAQKFIAEAINHDPSIFSKDISTQMDRLIVDPLRRANIASDPSIGPQVIIIDGLDECRESRAQVKIIQSISEALERLPRQFSLLLASRAEVHIANTFSSGKIQTITRRITLDASFFPDGDIELFLRDGFAEVQKKHEWYSFRHGESWPSDHIIRDLVSKSSGQFVYASTVLKFVDSHHHDPDEQLSIIIQCQTTGDSSPFADLDALYTQIFSTIPLANVRNVLRILGALMVIRKDLNPLEMGHLLILAQGEIYRSLASLYSLVHVPAQAPPNKTFDAHFPQYSPSADFGSALFGSQVLPNDAAMHFYHASLPDFLVDRSRAGKFFIDLSEAHEDITISCLSISGVPHNEHFQCGYAIVGWLSHFPHSKLSEKLRKKFLDFDLLSWWNKHRRYRQHVSPISPGSAIRKSVTRISVSRNLDITEVLKIFGIIKSIEEIKVEDFRSSRLSSGKDGVVNIILRDFRNQGRLHLILGVIRFYSEDLDKDYSYYQELLDLDCDSDEDYLLIYLLRQPNWMLHFLSDPVRSGEYSSHSDVSTTMHRHIAFLFLRLEICDRLYKRHRLRLAYYTKQLDGWCFHTISSHPIPLIHKCAQDVSEILRHQSTPSNFELNHVIQLFLEWLASDDLIDIRPEMHGLNWLSHVNIYEGRLIVRHRNPSNHSPHANHEEIEITGLDGSITVRKPLGRRLNEKKASSRGKGPHKRDER